jgi:hypothetical protein
MRKTYDEIERDTMARLSARHHIAEVERMAARIADLEAERDAARAASARLSEVLQETATEAADLRARLKIAEEGMSMAILAMDNEPGFDAWKIRDKLYEALAAIRKEGE